MTAISSLRVGQVVTLKAGAGEPASDEDRKLNVVTVHGNSALLSDGTRISICGSDEGYFYTNDVIDRVFKINEEAHRFLHKVGDHYPSEFRPITAHHIQANGRFSIYIRSNYIIQFDLIDRAGVDEIFISVMVPYQGSINMFVGDSLIFDGQMIATFRSIQNHPLMMSAGLIHTYKLAD